MKKFYINNKEELNSEELRTGRVSYKRIIDRYISDLVLSNEVANLEPYEELYDNMQNGYEDMEIYQYYVCNLTEFEKEKLLEYGIILSYSNVLDVDVLCVDHFGTSWDYVMTDVKWTDNWDEM